MPVFITVKDEISPDPLAARPMEVFELTQLYTVPATFPENVTPAVVSWWHNTWFGVRLTVGIGLAIMVKREGVPWQVAPE